MSRMALTSFALLGLLTAPAAPAAETPPVLDWQVGTIDPAAAVTLGGPIPLRDLRADLHVGLGGYGVPFASLVVAADDEVDWPNKGNTFYEGRHAPGENPSANEPRLPTFEPGKRRPTLGILTLERDEGEVTPEIYVTSNSKVCCKNL